MKNITVNMNVEALNAQLAASEKEVATITEQLKAAKKAKRAYERLVAALKEQSKATKKVIRATKKALSAIEETTRWEEQPQKAIPTMPMFDYDLVQFEELSASDLQAVDDLIKEADEMFVRPVKRPIAELRQLMPSIFIHSNPSKEEKAVYFSGVQQRPHTYRINMCKGGR